MPTTREGRLLSWAGEIEAQVASQRSELRRARMELVAAQEVRAGGGALLVLCWSPFCRCYVCMWCCCCGLFAAVLSMQQQLLCCCCVVEVPLQTLRAT